MRKYQKRKPPPKIKFVHLNLSFTWNFLRSITWIIQPKTHTHHLVFCIESVFWSKCVAQRFYSFWYCLMCFLNQFYISFITIFDHSLFDWCTINRTKTKNPNQTKKKNTLTHIQVSWNFMSFTCQMLYLSLFCWIINSTEHRNYEYEHKNCMVVFYSFLLVLSSYQPYIINAFYPSTCSPYLIFRFHLEWKNR